MDTQDWNPHELELELEARQLEERLRFAYNEFVDAWQDAIEPDNGISAALNRVARSGLHVACPSREKVSAGVERIRRAQRDATAVLEEAVQLLEREGWPAIERNRECDKRRVAELLGEAGLALPPDWN
jgi:hypothetical protein